MLNCVKQIQSKQCLVPVVRRLGKLGFYTVNEFTYQSIPKVPIPSSIFFITVKAKFLGAGKNQLIKCPWIAPTNKPL